MIWHACCRLATLEQKLIRQESSLKEKLSEIVVDMQSQCRAVEQSIDRWKVEVDGLLTTKMSAYKSELDTRLRDGEIHRNKADIDSLSTQLMKLNERVSTQNGAMEDCVKGILMRLDTHEEMMRPKSGDDSSTSMKVTKKADGTGDASNSSKGGMVDHSGDGGGASTHDEDPLSRFHTMISSINSDIATIEEHLDEYSTDPQLLLGDEGDDADLQAGRAKRLL